MSKPALHFQQRYFGHHVGIEMLNILSKNIFHYHGSLHEFL